MALQDRRTSRYAAALQQGWRVPFGPLGALTAPLIKAEFGHRGLICFVAGVLPWLRLRTVLRASCPSDARGMNRHRELGCIGTVDYRSNFRSFDHVP